MEKTYFISFEGIDGCGKDTQLTKLVDIVREDNGYPFGDKYSTIWITREPTKITESGIKIAKLIRERDVSGEEAAKYFIKDRKEHSQIIKSVLKYSHVFISRYDLSTLSYQMSQGIDFDELYERHMYNKDNGCLIPDLTIIFDLPVDVAFERIKNRNSSKECFEKKYLQEKVKENLKFCVENLRKKDGRKIIVINANQSITDVTKEMIKKIEEILRK